MALSKLNPSAPGWIEKFLQFTPLIDAPESNLRKYYLENRDSGFIYGHILRFHTQKTFLSAGWTDEERSKLGLFIALYRLYIQLRPDFSEGEFLNATLDFYRTLHPKGFDLFSKMIPKGKAPEELEKIISERVQTNSNLVSKNFSHIVTNALLFLDILAFRYYLMNETFPKDFLKKAEEVIISVVSVALESKSQKTDYDDLLIRLFDASLRYTRYADVAQRPPDCLPLELFQNELERYYLLDLAGLSLWTDGKIDTQEQAFLYNLGQQLGLDKPTVLETIEFTQRFMADNKNDIPYFQYSNPVKHFYDNLSESVIVLIKRNKSRLAREISQSGELVKLLAASSQRDLTESEKKKVKNQLLDICKTIPSLTIFLLPGGSLLLPILIKFIPRLLPSAFNENRENE